MRGRDTQAVPPDLPASCDGPSILGGCLCCKKLWDINKLEKQTSRAMTCDCEAGPCWFSHRKTDSPTKPGTSVDWQHSEYIDTFWDSLTFVPRLRRRRQVAAEKKGCCAAGMRPSGWQDLRHKPRNCVLFFCQRNQFEIIPDPAFGLWSMSQDCFLKQ